MKHSLIFFSMLALPGILFGQQLPTVVSPSPQAQEFMKYIDYPVNYSSGLPGVDVPIYTIKSKELSFPISLSYHASGFKPNEKDNYAGQGWTLNAGGRISRIINNVPDEFCLDNLMMDEYTNGITNFPHYCDVDNGPDVGCMDSHNDPEALYLRTEAGVYGSANRDSEYDIFYYDYPGNSGKFIFERNLQKLFKPVTLPFSPILIKTHPTTGADITHFEIIDESGAFYRYGKSVVSNNDMTEQSKNYNFNVLSRSSGKTSWLLTEIISADKSDTISFEYTIPQTYIEEYHYPSYKSITFSHVVDDPKNDRYGYGNVDLTGMGNRNMVSYTQGRVTRIKFKNGEVRFSYIEDTKLRLDKVEVYAKGSIAPLKTIKLEQSQYVSGSPHWYKLDAVKFQEAAKSPNTNLATIQQYSFLYYPTDSPYEPKNFPAMVNQNLNYYETYSIDYWGFYNGADNSMLLAAGDPEDDYSTHPFLRLLFGTANRKPNPDYAKVGVLRQITYPTGGTTSFEYEGNVTSYGVAVGGLRVNKITNSTNTSSMSHTFSYQTSNSSAGEPASFRDMDYCFKSASYGSIYPGGYSVTYTNSPSPQINFNLNAQPITYSNVVEYFGDNINNIGRIERTFDLAPVMWRRDIIEDLFPSINYNSYTPWYSISQCLGTDYGGHIFYQKNYRFGKIFEKETDIYDASGKQRKKTVNIYTHVLKNSYTGLLAKKIFSSSLEKNHYYWKRNYFIEQLSQRLESVTTAEKLDNSGQDVITNTAYTYNDNNLPVSQITTKSDGTSVKNTFTHPNEESCVNCPTMLANNILTPVINKKSLNAGSPDQLLQTLHTDYNIYGKPLLVQTSSLTDPLKDEVFYSYDNTYRNLLSVNKANDIKTTYIWGYYKTLPVAKIENATLAEVQTALGVTSIPDLAAGGLSDSQNNLLRSGLPNAQITTYTYSPLVGMTSSTDPNGLTTYYDYDDFGRLKLVKDKDANILKTYDYHYKQ